MPKRLIYSVYTPCMDEDHPSTNEHKREQFTKYHDLIHDRHREYAAFCGADYRLCEPGMDLDYDITYNEVQFEKIRCFELFAKEFDEVVYLDFDAIPNKNIPNIFESIPMDKMGVYPLYRPYTPLEMTTALEYDGFDYMNVFIKIAAKSSMRILENKGRGEPMVFNTGVMTGGSEAIKKLEWSENFDKMNELLESSKEESIYPIEISSKFVPNNEVYMTYLLEDLGYNAHSMAWNYIEAKSFAWNEPTVQKRKAFIMHYIDKEFEKSFGELNG